MKHCTFVLCFTLATLLQAEPGLDLENGARCLSVRGSEFINKGETHVQEQIPVMDVMRQGLDMMIKIDEHGIAFVRDGLICNQESLLLDFGNFIDINEVLQYDYDLHIALDVMIVFSNDQIYCLVSGVLFSKDACKSQLKIISSSLNATEPAIPESSPGFKLFPSLSAYFLPLKFNPDTKELTFQEQKVSCVKDNYFEKLSSLKNDLRSSLARSVKMIYHFLAHLAYMDLRFETFEVGDESFVREWDRCSDSHAPGILRALELKDGVSLEAWRYPRYLFKSGAPSLTLSKNLLRYLKLISLVCPRRDERSVFSFLFGESQEIQDLKSNTVKTQKSFDLVRSNEQRLLENQRVLSSRTEQVILSAQSLNAGMAQLNRRQLMGIIDIGISLDAQARFQQQQHEMLRFEMFLLNTQTQSAELERVLESKLRSRQGCQFAEEQGTFVCATGGHPSFHLAADLMVTFEGEIMSHRQTTIFQCLPRWREDGTALRFYAHHKHFIKEQKQYISTSFSFPQSCLQNNESCLNLYQAPDPNEKSFGNCFFVNDQTFIYLSCSGSQEIRTNTQLTFHAEMNKVVKINLGMLPLFSTGRTLGYRDLFIRKNTLETRVSDWLAKERDSVNFQTPNSIPISPSPDAPDTQSGGKYAKINQEINQFFSPEGITGSHVMAGLTGIFAFVLAVTCCIIFLKIKCLREAVWSLLERGCCWPLTRTRPSAPTQEQAVQMQPLLRAGPGGGAAVVLPAVLPAPPQLPENPGHQHSVLVQAPAGGEASAQVQQTRRLTQEMYPTLGHAVATSQAPHTAAPAGPAAAFKAALVPYLGARSTITQ